MEGKLDNSRAVPVGVMEAMKRTLANFEELNKNSSLPPTMKFLLYCLFFNKLNFFYYSRKLFLLFELSD
ncbi:hypothetical protein Ancab_035778 [Ancistrocladus abbreviatus]